MRRKRWFLSSFFLACLLLLPTVVFGQPLTGESTGAAAAPQGVEVVPGRAAASPSQADTVRLVSRALLGPARAVAVRGDYAYVGTGGAFLVFDVSTPEQPTLRSTTYLTISQENILKGSPDEISDIALDGAYAYAGGAQLHIFDLSDPAQPHLLETNPPIPGGTIEIVDGFAYVAGGILRIFDLSDPTAPVQQSTFSFDTNADVRVIDDIAYVVDDDGITDDGGWVFYTLDVSDKQNPTPLDTYKPLAEDDLIEVFEHIAYLGDFGSLELVDVSDPTDLKPLSEMPYSIIELEVADSLLFVSGRDNRDTTDLGLHIFSLADPVQPLLLGSSPDAFARIDIEGEQAYLAAGDEGLQVVDISTLSAPDRIGGYRTGAGALKVWAFDDRAYVQDGFNARTLFGLFILDVSDPRLPDTLSYLPEPDLQDLYAVGDYLFLATDGLDVYDLAEPSEPRLVWQQTEADVTALAVEGERLYLLSETELTVFDIANPAHPMEVGTFGVAGGQDVFVEDQVAYLACGEAGLKILDVTNPAVIVEINRWEAVEDARDVFVENGYAYVGSDSRGKLQLHVLDLTDMSALREVSLFDNSTIFRAGYPDLFVQDGYVLMADFRRGLDVLDVSRPDSIRRVGLVQQGLVGGVAMNDGYIYLTFEAGILYIMEFADTATAVKEGPDRALGSLLEPNYPNPFRDQTQIAYEVARPARVRLIVYDVLGRAVKTLVDQVQRPGRYEAVWDGTDEAGLPTASGFYLYRLDVDGQGQTRVMSLVR